MKAKNLIDKATGKYFYRFLFFVILLEIVSFYILKNYYDLMVFDSIVPVLAFTVVIMQLARKLMVDRAAFVEDYISKFFMDQALYKAFHDLIYTYDDDKFKQVEAIRIKGQHDTEAEPVFEPFSHLQPERETGSRLYHPKLFQGSPEEMRLDAVLGYFNVIAYRYEKGLLRLDDISGSIGYWLLMMHERMVIDEYLKLQESTWKTGYQKFGDRPPLTYLRKLMDDVHKKNVSAD